MAGVSRSLIKLSKRAAEEIGQEGEESVAKKAAGAFGREAVPESLEAIRLRQSIRLNDAVEESKKNLIESGNAERAGQIEKAWQQYNSLSKKEQTPEAEKALVDKIPELSAYFAQRKDIKGFTGGRPELAPLELPGSYPSIAKKDSFSGMTPAQPKSSLDALSGKASKGLGVAETGMLLGAPAAALGAGAYGMSKMGEQPESPLAPGAYATKSGTALSPATETPKQDMFVATQAKPEESSSTGTDSIKPPRSPSDMTELNAKIQEMADAYGEHGKALRSEADGLNAQLNILRSNFQGEMAMARNDYERQRTQQQWAQVGELIGRSLITMAAAARSLQKGKNFVTGLDPRSQVDWLSQLREARADMQDKIEASKATMQMGSESAEEQSKARLAEKGLAWEGKKLSLREQIAGIKGDMQRREQLADQAAREQKGIEREDRSLAKQQTLAEQRAMAGEIGQERKRGDETSKAVNAVLTKGFSQKEGKDREAVLKNLRDTFLSAEPELQAKFDEIVKSNSNSIFPDIMEPNYDSAKLGKVRGQLEEVLRESKKFKEQSTPRVTWNDYRKKWGSEGLNADEIQAQNAETASEGAPAAQGPVEITSKEEYDKLPSGAQFSWKGKVGRKP